MIKHVSWEQFAFDAEEKVGALKTWDTRRQNDLYILCTNIILSCYMIKFTGLIGNDSYIIM